MPSLCIEEGCMLKRDVVLRLLIVLFLAVAPAFLPVGGRDLSLAQDSDGEGESEQDTFVQDLLSKMTVAEKEGQLFLVPF